MGTRAYLAGALHEAGEFYIRTGLFTDADQLSAQRRKQRMSL